MLLFYVRHGDPIYNPDSLTPLGHEQAKAVAKRFLICGLDEIYASSSMRARQTAQPTCDLLKKEMRLCPWAEEGRAWANFTVPLANGSRTWAFSDAKTVQKFNSAEVRALGAKWYTHPDFQDTNFEKGVREIDGEVDNFLLHLGFRHDRENGCYQVVRQNTQRVALFAHQGMGMAFLSSLLDIPYPQFSTHFDIGHTGMTVIHFNERAEIVVPKVLQLANDAHLYREGLLTGYQNSIRF